MAIIQVNLYSSTVMKYDVDTDVSDASFGHVTEVGVAQPGARRLVPATSTSK